MPASSQRRVVHRKRSDRGCLDRTLWVACILMAMLLVNLLLLATMLDTSSSSAQRSVCWPSICPDTTWCVSAPTRSPSLCVPLLTAARQDRNGLWRLPCSHSRSSGGTCQLQHSRNRRRSSSSSSCRTCVRAKAEVKAFAATAARPPPSCRRPKVRRSVPPPCRARVWSPGRVKERRTDPSQRTYTDRAWPLGRDRAWPLCRDRV